MVSSTHLQAMRRGSRPKSARFSLASSAAPPAAWPSMRRPTPTATANFVMNVHTRWREPADERRSIEWARKLFAETAPHATGGVYVNFMPEDETERVSNAYGAELPASGGAEGQVRSRQPVPVESERPAGRVATGEPSQEGQRRTGSLGGRSWTSDNGYAASACSPTSRRSGTTALILEVLPSPDR